MPLTPSNQQPRLGLKEAAALLRWAIQRVAQLSEAGLEDDAQELQALISGLPETEDRLVSYADAVKCGVIDSIVK